MSQIIDHRRTDKMKTISQRLAKIRRLEQQLKEEWFFMIHDIRKKKLQYQMSSQRIERLAKIVKSCKQKIRDQEKKKQQLLQDYERICRELRRSTSPPTVQTDV